MHDLNRKRAHRVGELLHYLDLHPPGGTEEGHLTDLLRDARHWCDATGRDFSQLDRTAHLLYLSDLDDGGQP